MPGCLALCIYVYICICIFIYPSQSIWHTLIAQLPLPFASRKDNQEPVVVAGRTVRPQNAAVSLCAPSRLTSQLRVGLQPLPCHSHFGYVIEPHSPDPIHWSLGRGIPASAGTPSQRHLGLFTLLFPCCMPPKALQFHWLHYFTATQARAKASSAPSAILLKSATSEAPAFLCMP